LNDGEKVCEDWLVWSCSTNKLFCFSCCPFHNTDGKQETSLLASELRTIGERLMIKLKAMSEILHVHVSRYLNWKCLKTAVKENKGIDSAMQLQLDEETAKWRDTEMHIACYTF